MDYCSYLFFYITLIVPAWTNVNYCGPKICNGSYTHTFCKYREEPSDSCIGYTDSPLSRDEKVRLLTRFNHRRSDAARGALRSLPSAANMLKMRWVEELARTAQRWADQCRPLASPDERDTCRDLYSVSVGQCVASLVGESPGLRVESLIDTWYMQSLFYDGNVTYYVLPKHENFYGDFGQMMWANSHMVGCGRSRFMALWRGRLRTVERLVCNFAPRGPSAGAALWMPGPVATRCPQRTKRDIYYTNLCAYHENDDYISTKNENCTDDEKKENDCESRNETVSLQEELLWQTLKVLESNESFNYLGSFDEIYLTKLAIVTMRTANFNLQELYETSTLKSTTKVEVKYINTDDNVSSFDVSAFIQEFQHPKIRTFNLIGRPRPYHIDELTEDSDKKVPYEHPAKENVMSELQNVDNILYTDYDTIFEDKTMGTNNTTSSYKDPNELIHGSVKGNVNVKQIVPNITEGPLNGNDDGSIYIGNSTVDKHKINGSLDIDYIPDSETAKELEDALNRMERALAVPKPAASGKVRRELHGSFDGEILPDSDIEKSDENEPSQNIPVPSTSVNSTPGGGKNLTEDRSPVISMVMKYMPFLKQYEEALPGHSGATYHELSMIINTIFILLVIFT